MVILTTATQPRLTSTGSARSLLPLTPRCIASIPSQHAFRSSQRPPHRSSLAVRTVQESLVEIETTDDVPPGFTNYETLIILRPTLSEQERDQELAKFEAFLKGKAARRVNVTLRGRQRLAYPIRKFTEGIYALYTYTASPPTSQAVQRLLSTPVAGGEFNILRHMTVRT
ncbi:PRPS6 [Auxenochlorella protothecoides x Auxenochlorella symbiontica]